MSVAVSVEEPADPDDAQRTEPRPRRSNARRYWPLLAIAGFALAVRLLQVFVVHPLCPYDADQWDQRAQVEEALRPKVQNADQCFNLAGDSLFVYLQGRMLADGLGFSNPILYIADDSVSPSGWKPPLNSVAVAALTQVGLTSPDAMRALSSLFGALTVAVIGYTAWQLAGRRAGVVAAIIAALYPILWINDWRMLTESPLALLIALVILTAYRFWMRPTVRRAAVLGLMIGLGGYARFETPLLLVVLVIPLAWGIRRLPRSNRLKLASVAVLVTLAVMTPWWLFNLARFSQATITGSGSGWGLKNANCESTWFGDRMGHLDFGCFDFATKLLVAERINAGSIADESDVDVVYRDSATQFMNRNRNRFPIVAAARVGRLFEVYQPVQNVELNIEIEGRGRFDSWAGLAAYLAVLPLAVAGTIALARRRISIAPILGCVLLVTMAAAGGIGLTRYRLPADVAMVIVAGIGADWLVRTFQQRRGRSPADDDEPSPETLRAISRTSSLPRWKPPTALYAVGGAVGVVGLLLVVASSFVQPASTEAASAAEGATKEQQLCQALKEMDLTGILAKPQTDPQTLARLTKGLTALRDLGTPEIKPDAEFMLTQVDAALAGGPPKAGGDTQERTAAAAINIVKYEKANC